MNFLAKVKALFKSDKLDVSSRYELMKESISGTMSKFRVAREFKTGKLVGIKFLDEDKTTTFETRFKGLKKPSEGEIGLAIKHPRVAETYEYGVTTNNRQYIVMEYIEGTGLNALINNRDPILEGKRALLIRQMAEALDAVHKAGYIHRDICPRNYICSPGATSVKLIDFGLTLPNTPEFRQPGNRTGTPLYMAPEIVRRRPTDLRVDIFALGVTAYKVCVYDPPWPGTDTTGMAALAHDTQPPADILEYRPKLNKTLAKAIMQCLAVSPDNRPESAEHFLRLIRNVESDDEA